MHPEDDNNVEGSVRRLENLQRNMDVFRPIAQKRSDANYPENESQEGAWKR